MNLPKLFLLFMIYSFLGWIFESVYVSVLEKKPVNRGFLAGPTIPIYGVGALLVIAVFRDISGNIISLFLSSAVLISILEYITSWGMEKMFRTRWWDYSSHKYHINGRVCLDAACVFGIFSVLLVRYLNPYLSTMIERYITYTVLNWVSGILLVAFLLDLFFTIEHILNLNLRLQVIQEAYDKYSRQLIATKDRLTSKLAERLESLISDDTSTRRLTKFRKYQDIRLLRAFPQATFLKFKEAWEKLKDNIQ